MDAVVQDQRVATYIKDALTVMLESRPERPMQFLADYFHMVAQGRTPAQRAHRYVRLSPQQQAVFMDNVMSAYAALEEEAVGGGREAGVGGGRVRGAQYNRLLEMLLQDLPPGLVRTLLRVLYRDDRDTLELAEFAGGVKACLLFEEFLGEVEELFYTHAFQPAGSSEWVMDRFTLDTLVADLARLTHPEDDDRQDQGAREQFVQACQQACQQQLHLGVDGHVTLLSLLASLFRVLAPPVL